MFLQNGITIDIIGRPDDVYVYKGTSRSVSFSLKVAAMSTMRNDTNVGKNKLFSWIKLW